MFNVKRESGALGASITGLDLGKPLGSPVVAELKLVLAEYQVLFFRGQSITPASHRDLGLSFGPLMRHPSYPTVDGYPEIIVLENDRENPPTIDEWHVDMSFTDAPPLGSILIGRIVPDNGGDTMFASLAAAYDDLPRSMKETLAGLSATHSLEHGFRESLAEPGGRERLKDALEQNPDVVHPLVKTHPVTGRKLIFYSPTFMKKINELSARESDELLSWLRNHIVREKYIYRFAWDKDAIAFWDNRSVIHKPVNDYWPAHRRMERVTIGDPSVAG